MITQKIAVLLTCHNRRGITINSLKSLFQCRLPENYKFDVFLVDDGSSDGTSEAVKKNFPNVNIIQGNGQLYWNRGMHLAWNTAAKSDNFDFFLWLNDDVELLPNALVNLLNAPPVNDSIVVGNMRSKNSHEVTYGGRDLKGKLITPNRVMQECNVFNGNLVLVPNKVYEQIGNLDPIFPHAIGDYDYALRAKRSGIKSYISAEYSGFCDYHASPEWCMPEKSFLVRLKFLYSPLGNSHPKYFFKFEKRHYGILLALKHFFTIHLRVILPQLWIHRN